MPDKVVVQNSAYWELLAPHRHAEPVEFFLDGGNALTDEEMAAAGELRGRRVLHLACSVGDEALSFALHGAEVTAVDIAHPHLATGRSKAEALAVNVNFIRQDMMTLDPEVTGFDLIYRS